MSQYVSYLGPSLYREKGADESIFLTPESSMQLVKYQPHVLVVCCAGTKTAIQSSAVDRS